jgi:CheY-like chemotaxis protein
LTKAAGCGKVGPTLNLVLFHADFMTTTAAPQGAVNGSGEFHGATILLVAREFPQREELTRTLAGSGHRVLFPPSLAEARARLNSGDLLLLAVKAPGDEEFACLNALLEPGGIGHAPVILISVQAEPAALNRCLQLGALDALAWPVDAARLQARILGCLAARPRWLLHALDLDLTAKAKQEAERLAASLIDLGVGMTREKRPLNVIELILKEAMRLTDCEGGTIYLRGLENTLDFLLVRNDMLDLNMGGSTGKPITFPPLKLQAEDGQPNHHYVASHAALTGQTVNIEDAYAAGRFDFSGTRRFDASTGYHSKSFLTVPLKNDRQQVIGVLQLINARHPKTGAVVRFDASIQPTIEAFAVVAAAVLEAYRTEHLGTAKV